MKLGIHACLDFGSETRCWQEPKCRFIVSLPAGTQSGCNNSNSYRCNMLASKTFRSKYEIFRPMQRHAPAENATKEGWRAFLFLPSQRSGLYTSASGKTFSSRCVTNPLTEISVSPGIKSSRMEYPLTG